MIFSCLIFSCLFFYPLVCDEILYVFYLLVLFLLTHPPPRLHTHLILTLPVGLTPTLCPNQMRAQERKVRKVGTATPANSGEVDAAAEAAVAAVAAEAAGAALAAAPAPEVTPEPKPQ